MVRQRRTRHGIDGKSIFSRTDGHAKSIRWMSLVQVQELQKYYSSPSRRQVNAPSRAAYPHTRSTLGLAASFLCVRQRQMETLKTDFYSPGRAQGDFPSHNHTTYQIFLRTDTILHLSDSHDETTVHYADVYPHDSDGKTAGDHSIRKN